MYHVLMCAAAALFIGNQAVAQTPAIIGTWQVTSLSAQSVDTKELAYPFGQHLIGYLQYSPGGHMVVYLSVGNPKRAAGITYTDKERVDLYNGILGAYAGTYSVEGNKGTHHVVAGWIPEWIGGDQIRYAARSSSGLAWRT